MEKRKIYLKVLVNTLIAIAVLLFVVFLLPRLLHFFLPFVIGWIIAMIANPLVRFLEKKVRIVRKHSSALIIIGVLAAVVGIIYLAGSLIIKEVVQFSADLPNLYKQINEGFTLFTSRLSKAGELLPGDSRVVFNKLSATIAKIAAEFVAGMNVPTISQAGDVAKNILDGLFVAIVTILSAYFFIADRDHLVSLLRKGTPYAILEKFDMVTDNFKRAFGGYFRAQFKIMIVIWFILFIGFTVLKVNYAFLFALVVAFIDLLPFFGTGIVMMPWAVYEFVVGEMGTAIILVVIYLICQVVKQVLQPKMVGDSIGISPLSTLFFMFIGYRIGGLFGLIIGIPIGMVLVNFYDSGVFDSLLDGYKMIIHDLSEYLKM